MSHLMPHSSVKMSHFQKKTIFIIPPKSNSRFIWD
jgi:hypothetical protein